jgi:hypothetical protein
MRAAGLVNIRSNISEPLLFVNKEEYKGAFQFQGEMWENREKETEGVESEQGA